MNFTAAGCLKSARFLCVCALKRTSLSLLSGRRQYYLASERPHSAARRRICLLICSLWIQNFGFKSSDSRVWIQKLNDWELLGSWCFSCWRFGLRLRVKAFQQNPSQTHRSDRVTRCLQDMQLAWSKTVGRALQSLLSCKAPYHKVLMLWSHR